MMKLPFCRSLFFYSNDAIKPDGTKVVQAMVHLAQLNILDLETGHVSGYRLEGEPDFSVLKVMKNKVVFYKGSGG